VTSTPGVLTRFRPDIEGLRALAVLLVVLDHLDLWPAGGFVGVDVFFTISGFLITGLVVDEIARTGRFSIRNFYVRRARRILPASVTVLFLTWLAARVVFDASRVESTVRDIWWSLAFGANINFANSGTSYFASYNQPSLVQHYWSLAVEEQFYVLWPLLLLAATVLAARRQHTDIGRVVLRTCLTAAALSLVWCVIQTAVNPSAAYFDTAGRAWELAAGAAVALMVRRGISVPAHLAGPMCLAGILGILAAAATLDEHSVFPGPTALLPVMASCLVLAAGARTTEFGAGWFSLLTNPISRAVGRVSFSLYLVHWPVILVVAAILPLNAGVTLPLTVVVIAFATVLSFFLVETPFHRSKGSSTKEPAPARPGSRRWMTSTAVLVTATCAALLATAVLLHQLRPTSSVPTVAAPSAGGPETAALQQELALALQAPEWPQLNPGMPEVLANKEVDEFAACGDSVELAPAEACTWGRLDAPKVAYVVGDSTARAYMQTLRSIAEGHTTDWQFRYIGMSGCNFLDADTEQPIDWLRDACPHRKQAALDAIRADRPDMVIHTNNFFDQIAAGGGEVLRVDKLGPAVQRYTDQILSNTGTLVYLTPPPADIEIRECFTNLSTPADCIGRVTEIRTQYADAVQEIARTQGATYIESAPWFCVDSYCPAFAGTLATKKDVVHGSDAYMERIAPAVLEAFRSHRLLD
jgi:peptidoglycan/LPS O-acetylase OafA/YrhL